MARLGDICEILDSRRIPITASDREPGPYPYYGANGVQDYVAGYIFDDELVLLAEDGGNFGSKEKPIAYRVSGKCWVNNHAHVLKPKAGLDVDYLCYSLMYYDVSGLVNGATRQKLTQADMRKMEIPLPTMEKQRDIANILDKVSSLITLRKQQLAKLDELVEARFMEMFGDPVTNPRSWIIQNLCDVCSKLTDGTHFSPESYAEGEYRYITAKNIKLGGFDFSNITYVNADVHNEIYERCNPEYGDVLYIKDGVTTGIAMVNTLYEPFTMLSSVALLKQNREIVNGSYLCGVLNNKHMYDTIRGDMGGAAITRLTIAKLNKIKIPVPAMELQNQFDTFVEKTNKSRLTIRQGLDKLETLKKALMQRYFG